MEHTIPVLFVRISSLPQYWGSLNAGKMSGWHFRKLATAQIGQKYNARNITQTLPTQMRVFASVVMTLFKNIPQTLDFANRSNVQCSKHYSDASDDAV